MSYSTTIYASAYELINLCSHGDFTAIVELPGGRHEYKFFVDGQWLHDPNEVAITSSVINPRRACAARVWYLLCVSVCLSVTALAATGFVSACNKRHLQNSLRFFLD